ncbi:hypothetical protein [Nocardia salmonicida]|nr:hypothetical protein [Nocardia salmonicida]
MSSRCEAVRRVAAAMRTYVLSRPVVVRWMRRVFGVSFVALAGRLAVQNQ